MVGYPPWCRRINLYLQHLHNLKELGLDSQRIHKTALKLQTNSRCRSVHYAHKLITTRRAQEKKLSRPWSGAWGCQPPSRPPLATFSNGEGDSRHFGPMCLRFLYWCRERLAACVGFLFFSGIFPVDLSGICNLCNAVQSKRSSLPISIWTRQPSREQAACPNSFDDESTSNLGA